MKRSGTILIVLGLLLAVLSFLGVFSVLNKQTAPPPTPAPTVKVVVAAQDIPERTALQAAMVTIKDWPADLVPAGATTRVQDVVGKITSGSLVTDEPILSSKFSMEQQTIGLAPILPPGLVAVVLSLSPVSAVGGAVQQGDTVDIMISLEYSMYNEMGEESKDMQTTFYTIQDIPILAVSGGVDVVATTSSGGLTGTSSTARSTSVTQPVMLTVLVTPQDALLLKYAREKGTIDLALRSPQFHDQVVTDPVYLDYVVRRFELPTPLLVRKQTPASLGEPQ